MPTLTFCQFTAAERKVVVPESLRFFAYALYESLPRMESDAATRDVQAVFAAEAAKLTGLESEAVARGRLTRAARTANEYAVALAAKEKDETK